jgi:4-methyl-5(b-hydroxyethyl)-thiazole monophosphate biosynthesis
MSEKKVLVILVDGVEELEAVAPIDCLRRAGAQVTIASASPGKEVEGRNRIRLKADALLEEVAGARFDLVVVPGGPGHKELAGNQTVLQLLRKQNDAGGLIGSICAGPVVLKEAGVLEGRCHTSHPTTQVQLPERVPEQGVVRDGHLITSQGAGTAVAFALCLVEALFGKTVAEEVAASICC